MSLDDKRFSIQVEPRTLIQIRIIGDISPLITWAKAHETDRLWTVLNIGQQKETQVVAHRTLDDAMKVAAEQTDHTKVWFRREHDNVFGEPLLSCRIGAGASITTVAYLEPIALGFEMTPLRGVVATPGSLDVLTQVGFTTEEISSDKEIVP